MALTTEQKTTLAAHIRANTDPLVIAALTVRNDTELARLYNLDGTVQVYRTIQSNEYREVLNFTETEGMDAGKISSFEWMTGNLRESLDASKQSIRDGVSAIFPTNGPGAAPLTRAALIALQTRLASVFEEIYITEPGPTTLVVTGPVTQGEIGQALNENP